MQCVAGRCSILQSAVVCCSVLQRACALKGEVACVAVLCNFTHFHVLVYLYNSVMHSHAVFCSFMQ